MSIIFYGAGMEARKKLGKWRAAGLVPVCFADADTSKHFTKFPPSGSGNEDGEAYDVLPLDLAIKQYPDYRIYPTLAPASLRNVTDWLIERGIPMERIKYPEPVEWRRGCTFLGTNIVFATDLMTPCCLNGGPVKIPRSGNLKADITEYNHHISGVIDDLREGKPTVCDGCPELRFGLYPDQVSIQSIDFGTSGFPGVRCNVRCCYCHSRQGLENATTGNNHESIYEICVAIDELCATDSSFTAAFTAGEFTVMRDVDKLLRLVRDRRWNMAFCTNGTNYVEEIAELARAGKVLDMNVSLDSGTRETFRLVKGVDRYDDVIENLRRYAGAGTPITLKYILLEGINDNASDVEGFVSIAEELGAMVMLSKDARTQNTPLSKTALEMAAHLAERSRKAGLKVEIFWSFFNRADAAILGGVS